MSFREFIKEYLGLFLFYVFLLILVSFFFWAFHLEFSFFLFFWLLFLSYGVFVFGYLFYRRKNFYNSFFSTLKELDQKYLITEMDLYPSFLEGQKMMQALVEIDKSMKENLVLLEKKNRGFRDYIEMWIHEVKIPLSNLVLLIHNNETEENKIRSQLARMERLVEQVLYYVRSETAEKDYYIQTCSLKKVVNDILRENKDLFILNHVSVEVDVSDEVLTDQKWLHFILNQIVSNSLKYHQNSPKLKISSLQREGQVELKIWDNGMGISASDLPRVFEKSFTGENGRKVGSSTGMGLYICKNLLQKLGHDIVITSEFQEWTCVTILFRTNDYYEVLAKK